MNLFGEIKFYEMKKLGDKNFRGRTARGNELKRARRFEVRAYLQQSLVAYASHAHAQLAAGYSKGRLFKILANIQCQGRHFWCTIKSIKKRFSYPISIVIEYENEPHFVSNISYRFRGILCLVQSHRCYKARQWRSIRLLFVAAYIFGITAYRWVTSSERES